MARLTDRHRRMQGLSLLRGAALCALLAGCSGQQGPASQTQEQRYALKGTVVSIDRPEQRIVVDHEEIKGFMAAMTMRYPVADPKLLDVAGPGDQITADVVVTDRSARLENIVVVKKAEEPSPGGRLREKLPGRRPPSFEFVNQDGRYRRHGSNEWMSAAVRADLTQLAGSWS